MNKKHDKITISKSLAAEIGVNETFIITLVNNWIEINKKKNTNFKQGLYWTYNTYESWHQQLPFMSVATIRRTINKLEKEGVLLSTSEFNKMTRDKTKWYTINQENLNNLVKNGQNRLLKMSTPLPSIKQRQNLNIKNNGLFSNENRPVLKQITVDQTTPLNQSLRALIDRYMNDYYPQVYNKKHPALKPQQYVRVYNTIAAFCTEYSIEPEYIDDLIVDFFNNVKKSDHNINHFAMTNVLITRWYAVYGAL